eukprot:GHRR01010442.1.p1 GENE.GHRR01010442.1~~GHRR01010442.1.p1  ORF type:complete len:543 (+),score=251.63 GHRR01010442.1:64-1629(+)
MVIDVRALQLSAGKANTKGVAANLTNSVAEPAAATAVGSAAATIAALSDAAESTAGAASAVPAANNASKWEAAETASSRETLSKISASLLAATSAPAPEEQGDWMHQALVPAPGAATPAAPVSAAALEASASAPVDVSQAVSCTLKRHHKFVSMPDLTASMTTADTQLTGNEAKQQQFEQLQQQPQQAGRGGAISGQQHNVAHGQPTGAHLETPSSSPPIRRIVSLSDLHDLQSGPESLLQFGSLATVTPVTAVHQWLAAVTTNAPNLPAQQTAPVVNRQHGGATYDLQQSGKQLSCQFNAVGNCSLMSGNQVHHPAVAGEKAALLLSSAGQKKLPQAFVHREQQQHQPDAAVAVAARTVVNPSAADSAECLTSNNHSPLNQPVGVTSNVGALSPQPSTRHQPVLPPQCSAQPTPVLAANHQASLNCRLSLSRQQAQQIPPAADNTSSKAWHQQQQVPGVLETQPSWGLGGSIGHGIDVSSREELISILGTVLQSQALLPRAGGSAQPGAGANAVKRLEMR